MDAARLPAGAREKGVAAWPDWKWTQKVTYFAASQAAAGAFPADRWSQENRQDQKNLEGGQTDQQGWRSREIPLEQSPAEVRQAEQNSP